MLSICAYAKVTAATPGPVSMPESPGFLAVCP